MAQAKRTCVVIAGMHRSGTSALTRVLNLLGCGLAKEVLGGDPTNETGHWEPRKIILFNDELLESAGSAWDDWTACSPDWFTSPIAEEFQEKAVRIFADEYGTQRLTVMKDPRLARLLPFWLSSLQASGVDPVVMVPIRNPMEVAQSLNVRNGMDNFYNQLLWLRHVLDAEAGSRGVTRHFSTYDQLLDSWTSLISSAESKLGFKFPRRSARTSEEVDAYLADRHRHQRFNPKTVLGDAAASDWLKTTYAIMLKWSETGEDSKDYAQLDSVRSELDRSAGTFSRLIYRGKKAVEEVNGLRHILAERDQQAASMRGDFEHVSNIANQREHEISALQNQVNSEHSRSADLETQLHAANVALASLTEGSAAREAHLRQELEALRAHSDAERETSHNALQSAEERLQQAFVEINALSERASATEASYQAQVADFEARLHHTQSELAATHDQLSSVQSAFQAERVEAEGKLTASQAETSSLQAHVAALTANHQEYVASLEASLNQEQALVMGLRDQVSTLLQDVETAKVEAEANLRVKSDEYDAMRTSLEVALENEQAIVQGLTDHVALLLQDIDSAKQAGEAAVQTISIELKVAQSNLQTTTEELNEALAALAAKDAEVEQLTSSLAQLESAMRQRGAELEDVNGELKRAMDLLHNERHERSRIDKAVDGLKAHVKLLMEDVDARDADLAAKASEMQTLKKEHANLVEQIGGVKSQEQTELLELRLKVAEFAQLKHEQELLIQTMLEAKAEAEQSRSVVEQRLRTRFDEVAKLTAMLAEETGRVSTSEADAEWLANMARVSQAFPNWWAVLPKHLRRHQEHARYKLAGLFDASKYREMYSDVAESGIDPVRHYILHGMKEGRQRPS